MFAWFLPLLVALAAQPHTTQAGGVQFPVGAIPTPAIQYGGLDKGTCERELVRRHVPFVSVGETRGVLAPVRLTGPLHGVSYHSALPASQRARSPYEILDCRLVLALDDFSQILAKHDVVEVIHFSVYRPPGRHATQLAHPSAPGSELSLRSSLRTQHAGALAIDAGWFKRRDGSVLQVERDFHGHIGARTCGAGAGPSPASPEANELRSIVCAAADAHLFNVELTPDYNYPHRNHFHLEVTPRARWFLVH